MEWLFVVLGILLFLLIIVVLNIKIVPQSKAYVIERLGTYHATWETGLHVKIPFLERVAKVVSLKEQVADFPPQPVITKDNVTMQIGYRYLLPDHRCKALHLRRGAPDFRHRKPDRNHPA